MLRGPGEFLGARQSGVPLLRFADLGARRGPARGGARRRRGDCSTATRSAARAPRRALARRARRADARMSSRRCGLCDTRLCDLAARAAARRLRAADAARQADRHAAAAVADAVGGVARRARARPHRTLVAIFVVGTLLMRSAGCALNDFADRGFDRARRAHARPAARRGRDHAARGARARGRCSLPPRSAWCCSSTGSRSLLSVVALASRRPIPTPSASSPLPQALSRRRLRLRHPDGLSRRSSARCRASAGCCSRPTSSAPSPTTPSTRWSTATTTRRIGIRTSALTLGRYDVAAVMASYAAMLAILAYVGVADTASPGRTTPASRSPAAMMVYHYAPDPRPHARGLLQGVPAQQLGRRRDLRRNRRRLRFDRRMAGDGSGRRASNSEQ